MKHTKHIKTDPLQYMCLSQGQEHALGVYEAMWACEVTNYPKETLTFRSCAQEAWTWSHVRTTSTERPWYVENSFTYSTKTEAFPSSRVSRVDCQQTPSSRRSVGHRCKASRCSDRSEQEEAGGGRRRSGADAPPRRDSRSSGSWITRQRWFLGNTASVQTADVRNADNVVQGWRQMSRAQHSCQASVPSSIYWFCIDWWLIFVDCN